MDILVVGTLAFDSVKTPFGEAEDVLGGSATYFSVSASNFAEVGLVAVVGKDFPEENVEMLKGKGVDVGGLLRTDGDTFRWKGQYGFDLNEAETLETHLNVLMDFDPKVPDNFKDADVVFLANIDPELQAKVLDQVTSPKLVACDTMNFWIEGKKDKLLEVLKRVDLFVINEGETRELAGEASLVKAAKKILSFGPKTLIVKRGEYGVLVFTQDGIFSAPAFPLEDVFDPTGAGDSFAGGLIGYLASSGVYDDANIRKAAVLGSVMASFNVESFSLDRLKEINMGDIHARFKEFQEITKFEDIVL